MYRFATVVYLIVWCGCSVTLARGGKEPAEQADLPPVETIILAPIELDNISIWVPANKTGPVINRFCYVWRNRSCSCVLPAEVRHTKSASCPAEVARLLAEYTVRYHEKNLPLTIFNGWQWEYSYSLCQYDSVTYDVPGLGGSWENSFEAVLTLSKGTLGCWWLEIPDKAGPGRQPENDGSESNIEVLRFDATRTRDGYPKIRRL